MLLPIFLYVVLSIAIAISAGTSAGIWVALHAAGGSLLALSAGVGIRASLKGDRTQKIVGSVIGLAILALSLWISEGFLATLYGVNISGPIWAIIGFFVCFMFSGGKLTSDST
jgi:hypothetical protein